MSDDVTPTGADLPAVRISVTVQSGGQYLSRNYYVSQSEWDSMYSGGRAAAVRHAAEAMAEHLVEADVAPRVDHPEGPVRR